MLVEGEIPKFNTIDARELEYVLDAMDRRNLSGFLAGEQHSKGFYVQELEERWAYQLRVKHAISVNSATSGLLCAAMAIGLGRGEIFYCPAITMSATACAKVLGAIPVFADIEPDFYCLNVKQSLWPGVPIFAVNLFGHPAQLHELRLYCELNKTYLIEDATQSPFALENGRYAGTIGHLGVFSLNCHKHLQSGEGGIVVTDSEDLADAVRAYRNHGEVSGRPGFGLNLRMTELTAAVALAQLEKSDEIISGRIQLAQQLNSAVMGLPGVRAPQVRSGCTHSYYIWAVQVPHSRDEFVKRLNAEGVPMVAGYVRPLYSLPALKSARDTNCPVAEAVHNQISYFPICGYSPTDSQIHQMGQAFEKVTEELYAHSGT